jgi:hypothetical protein
VSRGPFAAASPLALLALLLAACGDIRPFQPDERELVAWFIEDVAHGLPRRVDELKLPAPSAPMARLAAWAGGGAVKEWHADDQVRGDYLPPQRLAARRTRWPALRALFAARQVVVLGNGLVAARPDLPAADAAAVLPVVDDENQDRRSLDALLASVDGEGGPAVREFLGLVARARAQLDRQAGAEPWTPRPAR